MIIADNGQFSEPEDLRQPPQTFVPAPVPGGDQRFDQPGKFDSRRKTAKPIDTFTDLKQRPENFDVVEPVLPQSAQRLHPGSRPRQTFAPINSAEQTPRGRPGDNRRSGTPPTPNAQRPPLVQQSDQENFNQVQPIRVTTGRPNLYSQVPSSEDGRPDRPSRKGSNAATANQDERNSKSVPQTPVSFSQPDPFNQRGEYRQPHHGPGFGYQFSTSHEQDVNPPPPRFYRLENPQLPSLLAEPPRDSPPNGARPPTSSLNFNVGTNVAPPQDDRVPPQGGRRLSFRPPNSRTPQEDSRRGRLIEPSLVIEENDSNPQKKSPDSFDGTYKPLRRDPPRGRVVPPSARAFGRPASPNLKTPASEALKSDLGATVSLAPIKHFGPPAATPLPSHFQSAANGTESYQTTPTPFAGSDAPTTRSPTSGKMNFAIGESGIGIFENHPFSNRSVSNYSVPSSANW